MGTVQPTVKTELFSPGQLTVFVGDLLTAHGVPKYSADVVADCLVGTTLRGVDSHGLRLLPHYLQEIQAGRVDATVVATVDATQGGKPVDARNGLGPPAAMLAVKQAMVRATTSFNGVGFVAVKNSNHFGAAAPYALYAAQHDYIGIALTHSNPLLQTPPRGRKVVLGSNPICVAAPMTGEDPACFDASMGQTTWNNLLMLKEQGRTHAPSKVGATKAGSPTADLQTIKQLLPMGGYKGFGLAFVVEMFCSLLTGMPAGPELTDMYNSQGSAPRRLGHCFAAVHVDAFVPVAEFKARLTKLANTIRRSGGLAPGDKEKREQQTRTVTGIRVDEPLRSQLTKLAAAKQVATPWL